MHRELLGVPEADGCIRSDSEGMHVEDVNKPDIRAITQLSLLPHADG